jgi:hypothetical protein
MTEQLEQELRLLFVEDAEQAPVSAALAQGALRRVRHRRHAHLGWATGAAAAMVAAVAVVSGGLLGGQPVGHSVLFPGEVTTSGTVYDSASAASKAAGFAVPSCAGATDYSYDADKRAVFVHFGSRDLLLRVGGTHLENLGTSVPAGAEDHFKSFDLKVDGSAAVGREWDSQLMSVKVPDENIHRVGAMYSGWISWNHDGAGNVLSTTSGSYQSVADAAASCAYQG